MVGEFFQLQNNTGTDLMSQFFSHSNDYFPNVSYAVNIHHPWKVGLKQRFQILKQKFNNLTKKNNKILSQERDVEPAIKTNMIEKYSIVNKICTINNKLYPLSFQGIWQEIIFWELFLKKHYILLLVLR